MTLAIEVQGLHKTYRSAAGVFHTALKGIDLAVAPQEVYGFVGVNGAGKSTLIKSLVGLLQPSEGEAQIFGFPAGTVEAREKIGYLPEVSNFHEFLSAQELLRVHSVLAGVPDRNRRSRCDEALELVGLAERRHTRISDFSKGMKQRFGIAQALVGEPALLILDELTSGLDPLAQRELRGILRSLKQKGSTIFFSSHHMGEVESVCDKVAIIHTGLIRAEGTLEQLLTQSERMHLECHLGSQPLADFRGLFPNSQVKCQGPQPDGAVEITLPSSELSPVVDFVLHHGCLLSVGQARVSLEDFYCQIVDEFNRKDAAQ